MSKTESQTTEEIHAAEERGYELGVWAAAKLVDQHYEKWRNANGFENFATAAKLLSADILTLKVRSDGK